MEEIQESKLGTMPVGRLLLTVSLPIVLSMLVQAMYNVVDSIFVAQLSEDALTAVSLVFPVQNLMIAVGVGTGVGMNSLLGRRLGERNFAAANKVAAHGVMLGAANWLLFALVGLAATKLFFSGYASHPEVGPEIARMGESYMYIITLASPGLFITVVYERLLQATGRSVLSMVSQMTGAVVNIILDPIMIFGLLGFPALGVAGAAWATVIGQCCGCAVGILLNNRLNKELHVSFRGFRPEGRVILQIYKVGLPSILMQSIGSVMTYGINRILAGFGSTAVSVFGVYFKLQSFIFMPVFGVTNGVVPIVAYNYGAGRPARIRQTLRYAVIACFCIMLTGTLLFWIAPGPLLTMFNAQESMMAIGVVALRVISLSFPVAAVMIVFSSLFQALGQAMYSMIVSIVRQLVVLLPLAWLLSGWMGLDALWWAFPCSEALSFCLAFTFYRRVQRNILRPMEESGKPQAA